MDIKNRNSTPAARMLTDGHPETAPRQDIQFLRAFAVIAVIAFHFGVPGFGGGFIGVDVFFVISGYLIFGKIYPQFVQGSFSLKRFFEARIRRIFPALAVVIAATSLWGWFFVLPLDYWHYSRTALAALTFVSNHAFMGQLGYFDAASHTKPLLHTWSLSIEGQFYFWLPLILILIFRTRLGTKMIMLLVLAAAASLAWTLWLAYRAPESGFYFLLARAWEFVAGAICATLAPSKFRYGRTVLLACTLALGLSVYLLGGSAPWPGAWTLLPVGFAAIFIYAGGNARNTPVITHPGFQLIGDMSYSLYLWHWPVWVYAMQIYGDQIPAMSKAFLLLLIFGLSYLSWRWVERPFRNRSLVTSRQLVTAASAALLCGVAYTASMVITKGVPDRFPPYVARVALQAAQATPRGECFRSGANTKEAPEQFCVYGAPGQAKDATAILWGDSFANQYLTALSNASKAQGITGLVATMSGCRAFIETDTVQHQDAPHCKAFNREVYAYLLGHPEIETVILGRAWWDSDETINRTVSLIHQLVAQGRKVIVLGPSPDPGMNVETAWATRQIEAGHPIDEIRIEISPSVILSVTLEKLNAQLEKEIENGKVFLIDPVQRFCDSRFCYLVRDGIATFRDYGHFTEIAAQEMEPDFRNALVWAK